MRGTSPLTYQHRCLELLSEFTVWYENYTHMYMLLLLFSIAAPLVSPIAPGASPIWLSHFLFMARFGENRNKEKRKSTTAIAISFENDFEARSNILRHSVWAGELLSVSGRRPQVREKKKKKIYVVAGQWLGFLRRHRHNVKKFFIEIESNDSRVDQIPTPCS